MLPASRPTQDCSSLGTSATQRIVTFPNLGRYGRLGNQLFQIAATIGVARENSCAFAFPSWSFADFFATPLPQVNGLQVSGRHVEQSYAFQKIGVSESLNLYGYFQTNKYFQHCEAEIRFLFRLTPGYCQRLETKYSARLEGATCSIHVRRGDYLRSPRFIRLSETTYYERALKLFDSSTRFVVFSDDLPWCRTRFRGEQFTFIENELDIVDLFLMSRCQSHIIANPTFSWWGAWLNPSPLKTVIAPAIWFAGSYADPYKPYRDRRGRVSGYHDMKDLLPGDWISL